MLDLCCVDASAGQASITRLHSKQKALLLYIIWAFEGGAPLKAEENHLTSIPNVHIYQHLVCSCILYAASQCSRHKPAEKELGSSAITFSAKLHRYLLLYYPARWTKNQARANHLAESKFEAAFAQKSSECHREPRPEAEAESKHTPRPDTYRCRANGTCLR